MENKVKLFVYQGIRTPKKGEYAESTEGMILVTRDWEPSLTAHVWTLTELVPPDWCSELGYYFYGKETFDKPPSVLRGVITMRKEKI